MRYLNHLPILLVGATLSLNTACHDCEPASQTGSVTPNQAIEMIETSADVPQYRVISGDRLVFEYIDQKSQCADVYDDEHASILTFELPSDVTEFNYQDAELTDLKAFYTEMGAWTSNLSTPVTSGTLGGRWSEGRWQIQADLEVPHYPSQVVSVQFDLTFMMNSR